MHDTRVITGHESYFTVGFSKMDSLVCWPQAVGNSLFLNHNHGADLALSIADQSAQKANCVLPNPPSFGCLGCNESSDVTAIVVVLLLLCVAGVILFSLELRAETWFTSQPKWFTSEWCFQAIQIAVIFFLNTLCYVSGTLECGIISFFFIFLLFRSFPCSV